ncbi:MAG: hypothetical protein FWB91_05400 [Defluviitaleaceae bacterium]|nr:hypothetical protein [Defluviitaleaceae bacterium]
MTVTRETIKNLLANLVVFLLFLNALSTIYFLVFADVNFASWLLIIPFLLMQYIRANKAMPVSVFLMLHAVLAVVTVFLMGNWFPMVLIGIFMAVACVYSFVARVRREWEMNRAMGINILIAHIVMFLLTSISDGNPEIIRLQILGTSLIILGFIIAYIHMDNVDIRLNMIQRMDNNRHSADNLLANNNRLILVFSSVVVFIGAAVITLPFGRMILSTLEAGRGFIASLLQLLRRPPADIELQLQPQQDFADYVYDFDYYYGYNPLEAMITEEMIEETEEVLLIIEQINFWTNVLIAVFTVCFLTYLFYKNFILSKRKRAGVNKTTDSTTTLAQNILSDLRDLFPRFGSLSRNAIRRAYAKKVNRHIRHGADIRLSDTTDIIAEKIPEDIEELTAMYEKVRYGQWKR